MENFGTWGPAERIVAEALIDIDNPTGLSVVRRITDALRNAGMLNDPDSPTECTCWTGGQINKLIAEAQAEAKHRRNTERPHAWEIVKFLRDNEGGSDPWHNVLLAAEEFDVSPHRIHLAIAYYSDHRQEVDDAILKAETQDDPPTSTR
jgi:hypothetical protein